MGLKTFLIGTFPGRLLMMLPRAWMALKGTLPPLLQIFPWVVRSREYVNFTYDTTDLSQYALCAMAAQVAGVDIQQCRTYVRELLEDQELAGYLREQTEKSDRKWSSDAEFRPGKRLFYYVMVRARKPQQVVEAGVDKGLGAVIISKALQKNRDEGFAGEYTGIEFNTTQSCALYTAYPRRSGTLVYGSSPDVVRAFPQPINLFIHDTLNESGHVQKQFDALLGRLAPDGVVLAPWTTQQLMDIATANGKRFLSHHEETKNHWYAGARLFAMF